MGYNIAISQRLSKRLNAGMVLWDPLPIPARISAPPRFTLGIGFDVSNKVTVYADLDKSGRLRPSFKFGTEYTVTDHMILRLGTSTNPPRFHFGTSLKWNDFLRITMATTYHLTLGLSPSFDITFVP